MIDFNKYAKEIHEQNKSVGWWDDPNRNVLETLQLVSTEIAEATEGERKDLMDDHLPHRKMGEVELADALIRMLDIGGRCGWTVDHRRAEEVQSAITGAVDHGTPVAALHLMLNCVLCNMVEECKVVESLFAFDSFAGEKGLRVLYSQFSLAVAAVAETQGYDIESAMIEKLEYNRHREDHKRENRAKGNGKKF